MNEQMTCFVLAGGAGTRLWPLSRPDKPKQFHELAGSGSMLAQTLHRLNGRPRGKTSIFVVAAKRHADLVHRELADLDLAKGGALFEPEGRDTAAAVALATLKTLRTVGDGLTLVVPSDHEISTVEQFWETIENGIPAARDGRLVLFGIEPRWAELDYGYIEAGERRGTAFEVRRFVEKPDRAAAERYLREGSFFWNAGIFLFSAEAMRRAFLALQPAIWTAVEQAFGGATDANGTLYLPAGYGDAPAISIDRAIVERVDNLALVPASFSWRDVGSWGSLQAAGQADENGNVLAGDVVAVDCRDSYLRSEGRSLSVAGANGLTIVSTPDAVFVAPAGRSHEVRRIATALNRDSRPREESRHAPDEAPRWGHWRPCVRRWLFDEALPLWSRIGADMCDGGFHEAVGFDAKPRDRPKRMRTMARQVYSYARAARHGWNGPVDGLIEHGLAFMAANGRTVNGGWVRTLNGNGTVLDAAEDSYDHACVLMALAEAHRCG